MGSITDVTTTERQAGSEKCRNGRLHTALTVAASLALAAGTLESSIGYQGACDLMSVQASIRVAK